MLDIAAVRLDRSLPTHVGEGLLKARNMRGIGVIAWAVGVFRKI
jgi:hypothetical protein